MSRSISVALAQLSFDANPALNLERCLAQIDAAAHRGAELMLLPELHNTRYFCQCEDASLFDLAEPVPGPTTDVLANAARRHGMVIVGSVFERRAPGLYHNTAVVLDPDQGLAGRYRKMHIPDDPGYYEKFYFAPGDGDFRPIATRIGSLGVLVCWDQWFPEAARLMALAGAEILLYPTAIGWDPRDGEPERARQLDAWRIGQRAHGVANGLPVMSCNRVGMEPDPSGRGPGIEFWGHSFVCGPQGELLADGPGGQPALLMAEVDLGAAEQTRRIWPFLRDRRVDAYAGLSERFRD